MKQKSDARTRSILCQALAVKSVYFLLSVTRLGNLLDFNTFVKPLATINLPIFPTLLCNLGKGVKIYHFWATFIDIWQFFSGHTTTTLTGKHSVVRNKPICAPNLKSLWNQICRIRILFWQGRGGWSTSVWRYSGKYLCPKRYGISRHTRCFDINKSTKVDGTYYTDYFCEKNMKWNINLNFCKLAQRRKNFVRTLQVAFYIMNSTKQSVVINISWYEHC